MTRRDFGARLSRAFAAMAGLFMILRTGWANGAEKTEASGGRTRHIQNRRLLKFIAGSIALADKERAHLHECGVCQEMACVLMRQSLPFRI
jgi:hypothetical protein